MLCLRVFFKYQTENYNKDADQEHEDGNPVDGIHITDPAIAWFVRIFFPDIKIFGKFAQDSHLLNKDNSQDCPESFRMDIFAALLNRPPAQAPAVKGGLAHLVER